MGLSLSNVAVWEGWGMPEEAPMHIDSQALERLVALAARHPERVVRVRHAKGG